MKLNSAVKFVVVSTLFAAGLIGCVGISSQDPRLIFTNGKWPEMLHKLSSQILEHPSQEKIVRRVEADRARNDLVRVAVIDNGVDLSHPDLVERIDFDVKDGKLAGAGWDVMGRDAWASAQIVDPSLFAFGAKGLKNGLIDGPPKNPLEVLQAMDADFLANLEAGIAAEPKLAGTFFSRLDASNFSI